MTPFLLKLTQLLSGILMAFTVSYFIAKYAFQYFAHKRLKKAREIAPNIKNGQTIEFKCERTDKLIRGYVISVCQTNLYCNVRTTRTHRIETVDFYTITKIEEQ